MCGRGNCEGECESRFLHIETCPVCNVVFECAGVDCPDDVRCEKCSHLKRCDWCHDCFEMLDGSGNCAGCAAELAREDWDAEDYAADDADAANKDEKESQ